nr:hypothetical protein CFP56_31571 [Quercus suber]
MSCTSDVSRYRADDAHAEQLVRQQLLMAVLLKNQTAQPQSSRYRLVASSRASSVCSANLICAWAGMTAFGYGNALAAATDVTGISPNISMNAHTVLYVLIFSAFLPDSTECKSKRARGMESVL